MARRSTPQSIATCAIGMRCSKCFSWIENGENRECDRARHSRARFASAGRKVGWVTPRRLAAFRLDTEFIEGLERVKERTENYSTRH